MPEVKLTTSLVDNCLYTVISRASSTDNLPKWMADVYEIMQAELQGISEDVIRELHKQLNFDEARKLIHSVYPDMEVDDWSENLAIKAYMLYGGQCEMTETDMKDSLLPPIIKALEDGHDVSAWR